MQKFTALTGVAAPLMRANIDTDVIIPMDRKIACDRKDLGRFAFEPLRYLDRERENPDFILNRAGYRNAKILLAGPNFGCGSSREDAVWALWEFGIRCVIAPSFGDIFFNNCFKNGLLPIVLPAAAIEEMAQQSMSAGAVFTVDLERRVIQTPDGGEVVFEVAAAEREALLAGLDPIGATLGRERDIAAFQARDRQRRPWIYAG